MKSQIAIAVACLACGVLSGCAQQHGSTDDSSQSDVAQMSGPEGAHYLLDDEPVGVRQVSQIREESADGDDVVVVGRIGGSTNPWVEGRAAFYLVDQSLQACCDIPGDNCPKPWDYCCETDRLPTHTVFVKLVDEQGELVRTDAKSLLGVKELSTVVVQGKAQHDNANNVTVLAERIFIKRK